jgi:hypothetical protein
MWISPDEFMNSAEPGPKRWVIRQRYGAVIEAMYESARAAHRSR